MFHLRSFFVKLWGFKIAIFANLGQLTRDTFRAINARRRFNPLRNRSKLVERSLFAIIHLLQGAKFILLGFIWRGGMILIEKTFRKKNSFSYYIFFKKSYYCSINLKWESEHSELCPDTSSVVISLFFWWFIQAFERYRYCFLLPQTL